MLRTVIRKGLNLADDFFVALGPKARAEGGSLSAVLFHSLYRNKGELRDSALAPNQGVTVEDFRNFVGVVLESGYRVVSPEQVDAGLEPGGNYMMITFDDGYYNNTWALDVLEQFQVPATFFVSSHHVLQNKSFWWDAFGRQLARAGASERALNTQINKIKTLSSEGVEYYLQQRFGGTVLQPHSDLDRPFTARELRDFARNKWVRLGNHTRDHAILTNYCRSEISRQVRECQKELTQIAGYAPIAIAYPNGNFCQAAIDAALEAGLRIGLTVRPSRNPLPLESEQSRMTLGRFLFWGGCDAREQCRKFGSSFVPSNALRTLIYRRY
jgi:peptidoglycan/xylan/chitin deacetylase (PgdA/CDA1 family)